MSSGILGQAAPLAAVEADLYICPARILATLKVIISNRASATTFKIFAAKDGAASEDKQELASDTAIAANEPGSTVSFMVSDGDIVRVSSVSGSVSFTATGDERAE